MVFSKRALLLVSAAWFALQAHFMPKDVEALSPSSGEEGAAVVALPAGKAPQVASGSLPPVEDFSDESSDHADDFKELGMNPPKRKGKRNQGKNIPLKDRLVSERECKIMVERRCAVCQRCCMSSFLKKEKFHALMQFRKLWANLHKLDQDRYAPWLVFVWFGLLDPSSRRKHLWHPIGKSFFQQFFHQGLSWAIWRFLLAIFGAINLFRVRLE